MPLRTGSGPFRDADAMTSRQKGAVWMMVLLSALAALFVTTPLLSRASDRAPWLCDLKGDMWVIPTHGPAYCDD